MDAVNSVIADNHEAVWAKVEEIAARDANGIYAVCGDISRYFYELTVEPS